MCGKAGMLDFRCGESPTVDASPNAHLRFPRDEVPHRRAGRSRPSSLRDARTQVFCDVVLRVVSHAMAKAYGKRSVQDSPVRRTPIAVVARPLACSLPRVRTRKDLYTGVTSHIKPRQCPARVPTLV